MFIPSRILVEKDAGDYQITKQILHFLKERNSNIEIINLSSNKMKSYIPGENLFDWYRESKKTLVLGVKKGMKFQSCKPSAHYQLPLVSGCMGQCEYCYLNTMSGDRPFVKVNVNIDDVLDRAKKYMDERLPEITIFEGAATSDPIPVEPYTHSLEKCILYFGSQELARFRFVTKYNDVDSLLALEHNGHTEIRFSINTQSVISEYEHVTASAKARIEASRKCANAGYPVGFLIAPVFMYPNWKEEYHALLLELKEMLSKNFAYPVTFEVISHRYTMTAKNIINQVFPESKLPMIEEERAFKYGQFGYGKYVYKKEELDEMKEFFKTEIEGMFKNCEVKYII